MDVLPAEVFLYHVAPHLSARDMRAMQCVDWACYSHVLNCVPLWRAWQGLAACLGSKDEPAALFWVAHRFSPSGGDDASDVAERVWGHPSLPIMLALIRRKVVDVNHRNETGPRALDIAVAQADSNAVAELLRLGARPTKARLLSDPVVAAVANEDLTTLRLLVEAGGNASAQCSPAPLTLASRKGHLELVKALVTHGAHATHACPLSGNTALLVAAQHGHFEVICYLCTWAQGVSLGSAREGGHGVLHVAATYNQARCVGRLCGLKGLDVDGQTAKGETALFMACRDGFLGVVETLLSAGADPGVCNHGNGWTPLCTAAANGHLAVLMRLLHHGAKVNQQTRNGSSALYVAAQEGNTQAAQLLLDQGARPSVCRGNGATPLFAASRFGFPAVVRCLAAAGADLSTPTADGLTPLAAAQREGHESVIAALQELAIKA